MIDSMIDNMAGKTNNALSVENEGLEGVVTSESLVNRSAEEYARVAKDFLSNLDTESKQKLSQDLSLMHEYLQSELGCGSDDELVNRCQDVRTRLDGDTSTPAYEFFEDDYVELIISAVNRFVVPHHYGPNSKKYMFDENKLGTGSFDGEPARDSIAALKREVFSAVGQQSLLERMQIDERLVSSIARGLTRHVYSDSFLTHSTGKESNDQILESGYLGGESESRPRSLRLESGRVWDVADGYQQNQMVWIFPREVVELIGRFVGSSSDGTLYEREFTLRGVKIPLGLAVACVPTRFFLNNQVSMGASRGKSYVTESPSRLIGGLGSIYFANLQKVYRSRMRELLERGGSSEVGRDKPSMWTGEKLSERLAWVDNVAEAVYSPEGKLFAEVGAGELQADMWRRSSRDNLSVV